MSHSDEPWTLGRREALAVAAAGISALICQPVNARFAKTEDAERKGVGSARSMMVGASTEGAAKASRMPPLWTKAGGRSGCRMIARLKTSRRRKLRTRADRSPRELGLCARRGLRRPWQTLPERALSDHGAIARSRETRRIRKCRPTQRRQRAEAGEQRFSGSGSRHCAAEWFARADPTPCCEPGPGGAVTVLSVR